MPLEAGDKYRHYKGDIYTFVAVATMKGTEDKFVVYRGEDGEVWVRPFLEFIEYMGMDAEENLVFRFNYISPEPEPE